MRELAGVVSLTCLLGSCETKPADPVFEDAGPDSSGGSGCPAREPRLGIRCGMSITDPILCSYFIETCTEGDAQRSYSRTYCCEMNQWESCGLSAPCEGQDAAVDMSIDEPAAEAGIDVSPTESTTGDAGEDAPLCNGVPPPMVCPGGLPCASCPGAAPAYCTCLGSWFCQVCADAGSD